MIGAPAYHPPLRRARKMLTRAAVAAAMVLGSSASSGALTIIQALQCEIDPANGSVSTTGNGPANATPVYESLVGEGIVMWDYQTQRGLDASVIRVCNSGRELRVIFPQDPNRTAQELFDEMVFGEAAFTLRQIEAQMTSMGVSAQRTRNNFGDCVCDAVGF